MAKKDKKSDAKKARAAEKQKKNLLKADLKTKKLARKNGDESDDDDIDQILEQYALEQAAFEAVRVDTCARPLKRLNPTMVANPLHTRHELVLFGGESVDAAGKARFYNELYTYAVESDVWRKVSSRNAPLPRLSHAMCAHPLGVMVMFGGEFSLPKQLTFYHYSDTWVLDCDTKEWQKVESRRGGPLARLGHRMACWKNYIVMHGGFRDLGATTTYLLDVWVFDVQSYKWHAVEFPPNHPVPDARLGHSLVPCADGAVVYGGYAKVKAKKGLQKGKVHTDCWVLKMKTDLAAVRFERRRKQGFVPLPRVGCLLALHKNRGILFGGVYDYEESEEQLDSEFYNALYLYQIENNRWYNLALRPRGKRQAVKEKPSRDEDLEAVLNAILAKANLEDDEPEAPAQILLRQEEEERAEAAARTAYPVVALLPHPRFNATTCVVDDTLYIYGGVFERGEHEFTLDSMYAIDLGRLDGVKVLWEDLSEMEREDSADELEELEEEDAEEEEDEEEEEEEEADPESEEESELEAEADDDPRPWLPQPKPFESLRAFYVRTGAQFLEWAISGNRDARGKHLKKASFDMCEDRFWERRECVSAAEDTWEAMGGVGDVIEKDMSKVTKRR